VVRARRVEGGALNGWHDVDAVEAVVSWANMGGRRGGGGPVQWAEWRGGRYAPPTGRLLWARPNRNSVVSY
jgi:hypothetical protein